MRHAHLIRRWIALDGELHGPGLRLSAFAGCWAVDSKTVRRDLAMFRKLGYRAECNAIRPGKVYVWRYPQGQRPMFTATTDRQP